MRTALEFIKRLLPRRQSASKGFTLIELLVVIGILAVLLAITLIAINPARQFSQANNTKRSSDVNAILNAVGQYAADNSGDLSALNIGATAANIGDGVGDVDLCTLLITDYLAEMPGDPITGTPDGSVSAAECAAAAGYDTGYTILQSATNNRITVSAPGTEIPPATTVISVTR